MVNFDSLYFKNQNLEGGFKFQIKDELLGKLSEFSGHERMLRMLLFEAEISVVKPSGVKLS
jgi:hypothetical protein